jgi:hypothetical protein
MELFYLQQQEGTKSDSEKMLILAQSQSVQLEVALAAAKAKEESLQSGLSELVAKYAAVAEERDHLRDQVDSHQARTLDPKVFTSVDEIIPITLSISFEEPSNEQSQVSNFSSNNSLSLGSEQSQVCLTLSNDVVLFT